MHKLRGVFCRLLLTAVGAELPPVVGAGGVGDGHAHHGLIKPLVLLLTLLLRFWGVVPRPLFLGIVVLTAGFLLVTFHRGGAGVLRLALLVLLPALLPLGGALL